jgi:hypothetical protein
MCCWRCRMEIPMLDEEEYKIAHELYSKGFIIKYRFVDRTFNILTSIFPKFSNFL